MIPENEILDDDLIVNENITIHENASIIGRFLNGFIDSVFIYIIIVPFYIFILKNYSKNEQTDIIFLAFCSNLLYYLLFEYFLKGKTIGKFITKTKVINKNGGSPSIKQVLIRILVRYMPFEFLTILTRKDKTALHDGASGTRVIKIIK
jgi:uncharacterized RDD family membrane protein YckC